MKEQVVISTHGFRLIKTNGPLDRLISLLCGQRAEDCCTPNDRFNFEGSYSLAIAFLKNTKDLLTPFYLIEYLSFIFNCLPQINPQIKSLFGNFDLGIF